MSDNFVKLIRDSFVACSPKGRSVRSFRVLEDILPGDRERIADELERLYVVEQERDNLQSAYEVVRGALDCIAGLTTHEWENKIARKALKDCSYIKCHVCKYEPSCDYEPHTERCLAKYSKVDQALSTTPEQAGERVRELVEALNEIAYGQECDLTAAVNVAISALAKYRGAGVTK